MTSHDANSNDISTYISLIDDFISQKTTAPEFESQYLSAVKSDQRILPHNIYAIIQELFEDVDAYVQWPHLRTAPEDLDDDQLRACAIRARDSLRRIGIN